MFSGSSSPRGTSSSSSSSSSNGSAADPNLGWKLLVAGAGALAAAVGLYYFLHKSGDDDDKKSKKKKEGKNKEKKSKAKAEAKESQESQNASSGAAKQPAPKAAASKSSQPKAQSESANSAPEPESELPKASEAVNPEIEADFVQTIVASLENMQSRGASPEEETILNMIISMDSSSLSSQARIMGAQWLVLFHTVKAITANSAAEAKAVERDQVKNMKIAWAWLNFQASRDEERKAIDLMQMDVAQRMKDPVLMSSVFDRLLSRGNLSDDEAIIAFTVAPILGRWQTTRKLGQEIVKSQGSLEEFHRASQQRPDIPDYEVLFQLAEEEAKRGDAHKEDMKWGHYVINSLKVRLQRVSSSDPVSSSQSEEWKEFITDQSEKRAIGRYGAIAQMLSVSSVPIPLVGPASDNRMYFSGYTMITKPDAVLKQTETYSITRSEDDPNLWKGEYKISQVGGKSSRKDTEIVFDVQMELEETDD